MAHLLCDETMKVIELKQLAHDIFHQFFHLHLRFSIPNNFCKLGKTFPRFLDSVAVEIRHHLFFRAKIIRNHGYIDFRLVGNISHGSPIKTFLCNELFRYIQDMHLFFCKFPFHRCSYFLIKLRNN
ncbi:hypothetical protein SDC9_196296 [bioreactor metagenome]|uniref:Uncharacterized protein n=1 Tax=bioreactor metagenome TaxID=1076179 RepID=A0A645IK47_9ZZZZ